MKAILDNPTVKSKLAANLKYAASKTPRGVAAGAPSVTSRIQEYVDALQGAGQ